jgi:hypothetical protein
MRLQDYQAGVQVRNPTDFTHKSVYEEMDRQAAHGRKMRTYYLVFRAASWFAFVIGFLVALRWITR